MEQIIKKKLARNWFKTLQEVLCKEIEELEGGTKLFKFKNWERGKKSNEGGGQSRIFENGKIFDRKSEDFFIFLALVVEKCLLSMVQTLFFMQELLMMTSSERLQILWFAVLQLIFAVLDCAQ